MSEFYSQELSNQDRSAFSCGNDRIDTYFRLSVTQDVRRNYARCYVMVEKATGTLAGFYTLSSNSIALTDIPPRSAKKLPRYPTVPAILIGWLGRDSSFRGRDRGRLLLDDAIKRASASPAGAYALMADAINEAAAAFYLHHLFAPLLNFPNRLFLPLAKVKPAPPLTPPPA